MWLVQMAAEKPLKDLVSKLNHSAMRLLLLAFLANLALPQAPLFGDTKFHVLAPHETSLPQNTFVFAVQNIETGKMHFGYATEGPSDPKRRVNTLLPGHTVLMAHDLGVSDQEFISAHLPRVGEGKYVCGGFFVLGNYLYVHPFYSTKGAGQLEPSVDPSEPLTGNGMLPIQNVHNRTMIPEAYLAAFLSGILKRYPIPFAIDFNLLGESPYFSWNASKRELGTTHELLAGRLAVSFNKAVRAANHDILGVRTRMVPALPFRLRAKCSRFLMALPELKGTLKDLFQI